MSVGLPLDLPPAVGGRMYLADLTLPVSVFKQHAIDYQSPFGHKFTTALYLKDEDSSSS